MEILIGIIFVIMIICIFLGLRLKNNKGNRKIENDILVRNNESYFPSIQICENENFIPLEKNKIIDKEIKNALITIDSISPNAVIIGNNVKNGAKLLNNNKVFFSSLKSGTENMQAVGKTGRVYGTQMKKDILTNRKLFDKQTEFTRENKLVKSAGKNALVNTGFNTAAMVVGQYYMNEINNKLEDIKEDISEISNFLDSEYQGRVVYIISKLKEIIDNKVEILNNEFSINKRYDEIINLESECAKLLGQANDELKKNIPNENIEYKKYEKKLEIISKWFQRQQILQKILLEIGNLRYVLACGNETSKISHTQYNNYLEQSNFIIEQLENLHVYMCNKMGINLNASRMNGKFYKIRKNTVGKIKEDWAYQKLDEKTIKMIESQTNIKKMMPYTNEKQDEIIKIQKHNGEYYNLL